MKIVISKSERFLAICAACLSFLSPMTQNAKGYMVPYDYAKELQYKGYATDTPEQIVEATKLDFCHFM